MGKHQQECSQVAKYSHQVEFVPWVKAHVDGGEVEQRAAERGDPVQWHGLIRSVGALATTGALTLVEDAGWCFVRLQARLHGAKVLSGRVRPEGPRTWPRKGRAGELGSTASVGDMGSGAGLPAVR